MTIKQTLAYFWKYYLDPIISNTAPDSPKGIQLRIEKLKDDAIIKEKHS
jgi:hypothetical protein